MVEGTRAVSQPNAASSSTAAHAGEALARFCYGLPVMYDPPSLEFGGAEDTPDTSDAASLSSARSRLTRAPGVPSSKHRDASNAGRGQREASARSVRPG